MNNSKKWLELIVKVIEDTKLLEQIKNKQHVPSKDDQIDQFSKDIYKYTKRLLCQRKLYPSVEVFDILLESYLRIKNIKNKDKESKNFRPFLMRVILNIIKEYSRKTKGQHDRTTKMKNEMKSSSLQSNLDSIIYQEKLAKIEKAMKELSPQDQQILTLFYIQEMSWKEIAKKMEDCQQVSQRVIDKWRKRGNYALKRLKKKMKEN